MTLLPVFVFQGSVISVSVFHNVAPAQVLPDQQNANHVIKARVIVEIYLNK